jgi:hypothetical protein
VHPIIEEICRASAPPTRVDVFRRWQQELRSQVQPLLDAHEACQQAAKAQKPPKAKEAAPCV